MSDSSTAGNAPPEPDAPNTAPSDLTREYATDEIRVQWYASRCIHSGECIRALPRVFNPRRRPWVDVKAADADAIAAAVRRCPTGALHYERADGSYDILAAEPVRITAVRDGPLFVTGTVEVADSEGRLIRRDLRMALCRCGQSKHLPFCDNTHRAIGFRTDG